MIFQRKPKRFIAVDIGRGRFQYLIPWAVYLNERDEYGYKRIPWAITDAHPELRLEFIMGKSQAKRVARWLNKNYPLDNGSQIG